MLRTVIKTAYIICSITDLLWKELDHILLIKSMKTTLKYNLPSNVVSKSAYSASKLSNKFNIKWKIKHDHHHVTYYVKYPVETCREDYIRERGWRLSEWVIDHSGRDKKSHVLKHCNENEHKLPSFEDFIILATNYKKNKFRRKISESLHKEKCSSLNTQEKSVLLKLFNWVGNLARTN